MNRLNGKIISIRVEEHLSLITIEAGGFTLKSIVIGTPVDTSYLEEGRSVKVLFKETEVIIGKSADSAISVQNKLPCVITNIESGSLLSRIHLKSPAGELTSLITSDAVRQLNLRNGEHVVAMVKTNEVMLS